MRDNMKTRYRLTQLDVLTLTVLGCYVLALAPGLPAVLAGFCGAMLCYVLVGLIWATAVLRPRVSVLVRLVAMMAFAFGSGIVGGLLLNFLPSGLTRSNWLTCALIFAVVGYAIARRRERTELLHVDRNNRVEPRPRTRLKLGACAIAIVIAIIVTLTSTDAKDKTFSELWLVPSSELNSPVRAIQAKVGVRSHEADHQTYTLQVDSGKQVFTAELNLAPDQEWTHNIFIEGDEARVSLYRGESTDGAPYRTVWVARR
jgi:hypothetical protein